MIQSGCTYINSLWIFFPYREKRVKFSFYYYCGIHNIAAYCSKLHCIMRTLKILKFSNYCNNTVYLKYPHLCMWKKIMNFYVHTSNTRISCEMTNLMQRNNVNRNSWVSLNSRNRLLFLQFCYTFIVAKKKGRKKLCRNFEKFETLNFNLLDDKSLGLFCVAINVTIR